MTIIDGLILVILFFVSAYIVFALYLFFWQARLVYQPEATISATPDQRGLKYEEVDLNTEDGVRLHGWYIPCESARGVVLFCHGNSGNISHRLEMLGILHRLHYATFIFDYRGYGKSEGVPSELGTYRDVDSAWRYLVEQREWNPEQIVILGRSLGGAIAAWLAARVAPRALVIESSFRSLPDLASDLYPAVPVRWITRIRYPTQQWLANVKCPLLLIHSVHDELIPFEHSQALFAGYSGAAKELVSIRGRHDDGFLHSGGTYESGLRNFLLKHAS